MKVQGEKKTPPDKSDRKIFSNLNKLITEKRLHLSPETTLDSVAQLMKINRTYLSQAVNRCTGGSFTTFINELRIKEAVRLLSNTKNQKYSIEGIALDVGFNSRTTFHRVFKDTTGLSPIEFTAKA